MKFLIDAQLPARVARLLTETGHDAMHTSELAEGNRTTDARIIEVAADGNRVVVTKDHDFRDGHLIYRKPRYLLAITTGNITNTELVTLFQANMAAIVEAFTETDFVELGPSSLVTHPCHRSES